MDKFKFLEHTADIKFQAFGKTLKDAFKNSVLAVVDSMVDSKIEAKKIKKILVTGNDNEALLYNLLEEIIYLVDAEDFLVGGIKNIQIKEGKLTADFIGDKIKNYDIKIHIKAVTYNDMFVKKSNGRFVTQVVLDI